MATAQARSPYLWLRLCFKGIECRKYAAGAYGTSPCMFVIKSKGHDETAVPCVIGVVEFTHLRQYDSVQQFEGERHRRLIPAGS